MVSDASICSMIITLSISLGIVPIGFFLLKSSSKKKGLFVPILLGMAGFFATQIMIRIPLISTLSISNWYQNFAINHYVIYAFALALSAALFEFCGRYIVLKFGMKKNLNYHTGIAAGLGHGGIEAIVLVGMPYVMNLVYALTINSGGFEKSLKEAGMTDVYITSLVDKYVDTPWYEFMLAGYERILTVIIQIALTVIVAQFIVKEKEHIGMLLCVSLHFILDFVTTIVACMSDEYFGGKVLFTSETGYIITYSFLTIFAMAAVIYVIKARPSFIKKKE